LDEKIRSLTGRIQLRKTLILLIYIEVVKIQERTNFRPGNRKDYFILKTLRKARKQNTNEIGKIVWLLRNKKRIL